MKRLLVLALATACGLAALPAASLAADAPTVVSLLPPALPITVNGTGTLTAPSAPHRTRTPTSA